MSNWDAVCDIIENLSPEDKERARVVSRGTRDALVPEARWGTEYRLLLAECAALKTEHDGYRFYVDAAGKSGSALAKATFEGLAAAEMMHIEVIRERVPYNKPGENFEIGCNCFFRVDIEIPRAGDGVEIF